MRYGVRVRVRARVSEGTVAPHHVLDIRVRVRIRVVVS